MPIQCKHVAYSCQTCGKTFLLTPSRIKQGCGSFCSMRCRGIGKRVPLVARTCQLCGKEFHVKPSVLAQQPCDFCSVSCARSISLEDRFFARIGKKTPTGCILWAGDFNRDTGYGYLSRAIDKKNISAHRLSYMLLIGSIPDGLCVLHNCPGGDNPSCINPTHFFLGTNLDNIADRDAKNRQAKGTAIGNAVLTDSDVRSIRARHGQGVTIAALAREYNAGETTIRSVVRRRTWKHVD